MIGVNGILRTSGAVCHNHIGIKVMLAIKRQASFFDII